MVLPTPRLQTEPLLRVTSEQFDALCIQNPDLRLELTQDGQLIVMPPTGGETGRKNFRLGGQVYVWNEQTGLGEAFDSSTGYDFTALGGGKLSPDVSWIEKSRLQGISITGFIPIVPDFVVELRSKSDSLSDLRQKMQDYQSLGVRLGVLINPQNRQIEIYRLNQPVEVLNSPVSINCDDVLPGFTLDLTAVLD